ncbi:aconitase family-domain-containing protein [Favolaschia claudopus]|uniref:Aconitase family-domain-containing protein n=1 Tax=Favolaschia claudopus TaxID=2862362 RepID=A0AAW0EIH3_9AGAR
MPALNPPANTLVGASVALSLPITSAVIKEGYILKKRRKRLQGFARRYFTLYQSGILTYAYDRGLPIRDQVSLHHSAISTAPGRRDIHIDSSTTFHIKCLTLEDFDSWMSAFRRFIAGPESRRSMSMRHLTRQGSITVNKSGVILEDMTQTLVELEEAISAISGPRPEKVSRPKSDREKSKVDKDRGAVFGLFKRSTFAVSSAWTSHHSSIHDVEHSPPLATDEKSPTQRVHDALEMLKTQHATLCKSIQTLAPLLDVGQTMRSPQLPITAEEEEIATPVTSSPTASFTTPHSRKRTSTHTTTSISESINEWFDADSEGAEEFVLDIPPAQLDADSRQASQIVSNDSRSSLGHSSTDTDIVEEPQRTASESTTTDHIEVVRRTCLPAAPVGDEGSLFAILKKNVGKDLSAIQFPITFNEPLTLLQRAAEEVEYYELLNLAAAATDPVERLCYVGAFAVSSYAHTRHRSGRKGFNPMLGETFEDVRMKFIAEKVRHNPLEMAYYAEGPNWHLNATSAGKTKFWGKSLEVIPLGTTYLTIEEDTFEWKKPSSFMRNLMVGQKYLEHVGKFTIENTRTDARCVMEFKPSGLWGASPNMVAGIVHSPSGKVETHIEGKWDDQLSRTLDASHFKILWRVSPYPKDCQLYYGFTSFGITLNEITSDIDGKLPPTDSRLRPDVRALEEGHLEVAEREKTRVEEAQRDRRRKGHDTEPRWFKQVGDEWQYVGGYWEARAQGWKDAGVSPLCVWRLAAKAERSDISEPSRWETANTRLAGCLLPPLSMLQAKKLQGLPKLSARLLATHAPLPEKNCSSITPPYPTLIENLSQVRKHVKHKLTLAEKILYSHLTDPQQRISRGQTYLQLRPERVAMQDASAQMALLQFMSAGLPQCAVPASIHCDHLIQAVDGAKTDLERSIVSNKEVFDFLESAAGKYGIEFWKPGSGIIHQIVLENYAAPGMLMLGTDSHTPNAGGLGMLAIGVGGADAVDALTGTPWELKAPEIVGIHLKGKLGPWVSPKDLILHLAGKLTVRGGTGRILEYFGPGVFDQSCTGLATVANMGAEVGATTSTFPYTPNMRAYLEATGRAPVARAADKAAAVNFLAADEGAEYDQVIEINLSELEPHINGPFTPDLATPLSKFGAFVKEQGWKDEFSAGLIGSCTNSSYQDMTSVADLARQAKSVGLTAKVPFLCTPGSEQIRATMERDNVTSTLEDIGAVVLANACGPCIGQWKRDDHKTEENAILTSFNRNFKSRNDGNRLTMNFLASPLLVTAMAFSGRLSFNPMTDSLPLASGEEFRFSPPSGQDLPTAGFTLGETSFYPSPTPEPQPETEIVIRKDSQRLELLEPFLSHFTGDRMELPSMKVLMRVRGKCTTDHISAAGPWLKYKGHLTNISENLLITAVNDEGGEVNVVLDHDASEGQSPTDTIPGVAKRLKSRNQPWALVVDENYGEGSAREHAALQPRFYGCAMIIARSFARIHETNLKKQGVLPLWFADKADYARIGSGDVVETMGLENLLKGTGDQIKLKVTKLDGQVFEIETKHTMSKDQLKWLAKGSALNYIRSQMN